jgi:hypothetical protein
LDNPMLLRYLSLSICDMFSDILNAIFPLEVEDVEVEYCRCGIAIFRCREVGT